MHICHVARQGHVGVLVDGVEQQEHQIEARHERRGHVDVLRGRATEVVAAVQRVCRGKHRSAGVQGCTDAALGNRHRLLLHHLVDCRPVVLIHLVELVDAADAHVRKH